MNDRATGSRVGLLLRLALAGVWLLAAIPKILDPAGFAEVIYGYQLLPWYAVNVTAIYLPWLELALAVFLLGTPRMRRTALWMSLALLVAFTAAIAFNLARGLQQACGCFVTDGGDPVTWWKVVENLCLAGLTGTALRIR